MFPNIKAHCLRQLEDMKIDLVDRVVLYRKYNIEAEILASIYGKLCVRENTLTKEESEKLGLDAAIRVFQARERLRTRVSGTKSPLPEDVGKEKIRQVVLDVFHLGA